MSVPRIEEAGNRYGRLVVVESVPGNTLSHSVRWLCICDCGQSKILDGRSLRRGETRSCGCLRLEIVRKKGRIKGDRSPRTHGMSSHPVYKRWAAMRNRCLNPKSGSYKNYGGRGINIFEGWKDDPTPFIQWIEENLGPCPEGYSLDRVDNDGNYAPGNLRWANRSTQSRNQRTQRAVSTQEEEILRLFREPIVFEYHEAS